MRVALVWDVSPCQREDPNLVLRCCPCPDPLLLPWPPRAACMGPLRSGGALGPWRQSPPARPSPLPPPGSPCAPGEGAGRVASWIHRGGGGREIEMGKRETLRSLGSNREPHLWPPWRGGRKRERDRGSGEQDTPRGRSQDKRQDAGAWASGPQTSRLARSRPCEHVRRGACAWQAASLPRSHPLIQG